MRTEPRSTSTMVCSAFEIGSNSYSPRCGAAPTGYACCTWTSRAPSASPFATMTTPVDGMISSAISPSTCRDACRTTSRCVVFLSLNMWITKHRRMPFPKEAHYRAKECLDLVHGDVCGPILPATPGGRCYFLLLVDDYTRYMWVVLLAGKGNVAALIRQV